jgi:hypothetical protein
MQDQVAAMLAQRLQHPGQPFQPAKVSAIHSTNKAYSNLDARLRSRYSARGFGQSGRLVSDARANEVARIGDLGSLDARFAGMQAEYEGNILDDASRFAFANPGSEFTGTAPGNMAGAVAGAGQSLSTLFALNSLLKRDDGKGLFG